MRGSSAEGLATTSERLESLASEGDAEQLGEGLFAVTDVLHRQPSLRRALTDPAAGTDAKAGLARDVFDGLVSAETVETVETAARARWSSASDFLQALEHLGVLALTIAADKEGRLSDLEDELFRFSRVVVADVHLRDALTNTQVPLEHRQALVSSLLEGKASTPAVLLVRQAVASSAGSLETALESYQERAADRQQRLVALVRTAIELNELELERLASALGRLYGRDIHLNVVVDPSVLGGIRVELGDEVIDGTVAGRLDDARRRMVG
ncbi:MAG: F0F1 ATP synthase subunit delta [Nocardioidaceae bacterium]